MYAAARALKTHGKSDLASEKPLTLNELAFKRRRKKTKEIPAHTTSLFLKSYYGRNKETLFAACRAVVIGATIIGAGLFMTILGYFDQDLTTTSIFNITTGDEVLVVDLSLRYKLKMMQYLGPVLMGFGTFLLIIACVITLESRDRHAMIIQEESKEFRRSKKDILANSTTKTSLLPYEEEEPIIAVTKNSARLNGRLDAGKETDRPNVSDFQHDSNDEGENGDDENEEQPNPGPSTSKKKSVIVEVHCPENANNATNKRKRTQSSNSNVKLPISLSLLRLNRRSDNASISREQSGSLENLSESSLPLSTINYLRKPKGQAPIISIDSVLELPLINSANCSPSLNERNAEKR